MAMASLPVSEPHQSDSQSQAQANYQAQQQQPQQQEQSTFAYYPVPVNAHPIVDGTPLHDSNEGSSSNAGSSTMPVPFPPPGTVPVAYFAGPGGSIIAIPQLKTKRRQVKNACTNCQKACKKCDEERPCSRCVKYGIDKECNDSHRKERKKGIKRGPYKKREQKSHEAEEPDPSHPTSAAAAALAAAHLLSPENAAALQAMAQGAVIYSFNPAPGSGPGTSTAGAGPSGSSSQNIVQHQAFPIGNSAGTGTQYYTISPVGAADQAPGGPQSYVATPGPADGSAPNPGENSGPGSTATSPPYYGGFQGYPGYSTQPSPTQTFHHPLQNHNEDPIERQKPNPSNLPPGAIVVVEGRLPHPHHPHVSPQHPRLSPPRRPGNSDMDGRE